MRRFTSSAMNFFLRGTKVAAVTFLTLNYVGGFVVCYGPSMEPTLRTRDVLLTEHISPRLKKIDIGDVVVARSPDDDRCVCKRVVAGPGDIVLYKNKPITVPEEFVWLEGDNKGNSNDSRYYGPVPYSMIRRRCFCKVWPQLDLHLSSSERFYLESVPTSQQIIRDEWTKHQQLQQESKDSLKRLGKDSNKSLFGIVNDSDIKEETFPMMEANITTIPLPAENTTNKLGSGCAEFPTESTKFLSE